jgi:hypothetical protein
MTLVLRHFHDLSAGWLIGEQHLQAFPRIQYHAPQDRLAMTSFSRDKAILRERKRIKKQTIRQRRLQHQKQAA